MAHIIYHVLVEPEDTFTILVTTKVKSLSGTIDTETVGQVHHVTDEQLPHFVRLINSIEEAAIREE